jgi:hypothetical protein
VVCGITTASGRAVPIPEQSDVYRCPIAKPVRTLSWPIAEFRMSTMLGPVRDIPV